jgi:octaheme c-type cytochrome (tetrathionate reductase family)
MRKPVYLIAIIFVASLAAADARKPPEDHADISGPFKSPMAVTKKCLECHEDAAKEIMGSSHWTWTRKQRLSPRGRIVARGKRNIINNFCISVSGNWPRCTSCHIGYGWKDKSFNFKDSSRVDCLACHDTTGLYKKAAAGAGMPHGFTGIKKFDKRPVDLLKVARSAGRSSRRSCLRCHANGGGGNNVKHGDMDQSLIKPNASIDVHMAVEKKNFSCAKCHETKAHKMLGTAFLVTPGSKKQNRAQCETCHTAKPHKGKLKRRLDRHGRRVACQTCHIPYYAKKHATKLSWDWSTASDPKKLPKARRVIKKNGLVVYHYKKGSFSYGRRLVPSYYWFNGTAAPIR